MISIYHNLSANNVSNTLAEHYGRLKVSTQRLSSGLRINGAADDAAGLAIRELMRSDVAALRQGMRNVNDGISLLQTMDGALGIIDEKLIRMKELAEQAATGTYDSTQRLMIDSEFQAMGSEIDRIANATDFNGIKMLCTKMISWFEDEDQFVITKPGIVSNLTQPAGNNRNPILRGVDPAKYVDANNPTKTISVNLTAAQGTKTTVGNLVEIGTTTQPTRIDTSYRLQGTQYTTATVGTSHAASKPVFDYSRTDPAANGTWDISVNGVNYTEVPPTGTTLTGLDVGSLTTVQLGIYDNGNKADLNLGNMPSQIKEFKIDAAAGTYKIEEFTVSINANTADYTASYNENNRTVTVNFKKGGTATLKLDNALNIGDSISFDVDFEGEVKTVPVEKFGVDPSQKLTIHFGTMNDSAEDYYDINYANCTRAGLGIDGVDIQTQEKAQNALVQVNEAVVKKDKVRAYFGAMQNRFENTFTNLSIQAENLQAAESRISDADIAMEMMNFVRNQILTQSAVAMLAQANSMPQMVLSLIH